MIPETTAILDDEAMFRTSGTTRNQPLSGLPAQPGAAAIQVLQINPAESQELLLYVAVLKLKFRALKVVQEDGVLGIVYNNREVDICPQVSEKYRLDCGDQQLQVIFAGGKISFGDVTLLSFLVTPQP